MRLRLFPFFVLLVLLFSACRKGKVLPHDVAVQLIGTPTGSVAPTGAFPVYNPNAVNELPVYPNYVTGHTHPAVVQEFQTELTQLLLKNNIHLTQGQSYYQLKITAISVVETNNRAYYADSCGLPEAESYVNYSSLRVSLTASLYRNNTHLATWQEETTSSDQVRSATDSCNRPKIRRACSRVDALIYRLAKKLRVRISRELHDLET